MDSRTLSQISTQELLFENIIYILCSLCTSFSSGYYGITSKQMSKDMNLISNENMETKMVITAEEEHEKSLSKPVHICITNAASPVVYQMINEIARGMVTQLFIP